jgi:pantetheine-phosphate adenylyltransferase
VISPTTRVTPATVAHTVTPYIPLHYLRDPVILNEMAQRWCERQRYWHGPNHLLAMLRDVDALRSDETGEILSLAALYHDVIYDPRASDNEEASADLLLQHAEDPRSGVVCEAVKIIRASKWSERPTSPLIQQFFELDTHQLSDQCPLSERLAYERAIFREYQWVDDHTYRTKRWEFLQKWARLFPEHRRGVAECQELLQGLRPRIAIYPGSFNPFHAGHLSILRQAEAVFDKVIIAVGVNRQKAGALETAQSRCVELQSRLRFHEVSSFDGLLTDFIDRQESPITVVRGVRDGTDLEAELRYVRFLNDLRPETSVVWINCEAELQHLSSSAIRELESIEPGASKRYVPDTATIYCFHHPTPSHPTPAP